MPTGTASYPLLRGFVPFGELDVLYDLLRAPLALQIPMWEGSDLPYLWSPQQPGAGGIWIRPTIIGTGPSWTWNPNAGNTGWPRGQNAVQVYAENGKAIGAQGLTYLNVLDPIISQFVVGNNFSILAVGTPMAYQNPNLTFLDRGNSDRRLFSFKTGGGVAIHTVTFNYAYDLIKWYEYTAVGSSTPIVPYYGERCSFLFVHGSSKESNEKPRVFIGKEDGTVSRADFTANPGHVRMLATAQLDMFNQTAPNNQEGTSAGGTWEYFGYFIRAFTEEEACAICRDALGLLRWDPYVVRRIGWKRPPELLHQLSADPRIYPRVSAHPAVSSRVAAAPAFRPRVSGWPTARSRVSAEPSTRSRISARVRIADQEIEMRATPLCPATLNWLADNILELADVMDDLPATPIEIVAADAVTCEIFDADTDAELTVVSPVSLSQVGSTNVWRASVLVNEANGFALAQRLRFVFLFDGGAGLQGRFEALGVVASATS